MAVDAQGNATPCQRPLTVTLRPRGAGVDGTQGDYPVLQVRCVVVSDWGGKRVGKEARLAGLWTAVLLLTYLLAHTLIQQSLLPFPFSNHSTSHFPQKQQGADAGTGKRVIQADSQGEYACRAFKLVEGKGTLGMCLSDRWEVLDDGLLC